MCILYEIYKYTFIIYFLYLINYVKNIYNHKLNCFFNSSKNKNDYYISKINT